MIRAIKNFLKRFWPSLRLRTILFATLVFVAALPGFGAVFLRVYENTLVQQTEAELIAQGAVLASAYRSFWGADPEIRPITDPIPERPSIDLNAMPILAEQMAARRLPGQPDPRAVQVAARMLPIVAESGHVTLAAIR
ncbi:MAG TPA: sensor histidine kinase, partial [Allosphingosinicella sp.]